MSRGKVVDLFCGAGGASLGFVKAGFEIVGAVDAEKQALDTYEENLCENDLNQYPGSVSFESPLRANLGREFAEWEDGELESVAFEDIRDYFGLEPGEVDVICGCPPCQNFSSLRDTESWPEGKPKDDLLRAYVEFVREEKPDTVFFENVSNIMKAGEDVPSAYVDWLVSAMSEIVRDGDSATEGGYGHALEVVNAADYGVPQRRERTIGVFVYGADDDDIVLPNPTHAEDPEEGSSLKRWKTVRDVIFRDDLKTDLELGQKQVGIEGYPDDPEHRTRRHQESTVEMAKAIRRHGRSWTDLRGTEDEDLIKECHQNLKSGAESAYGIMAPDMPCRTLTTRCTTISSGRFTHPTENRSITFREAALLMDFPDWYRLPNTNKYAERAVGNAVPPTLVEKMTEAIPDQTSAVRNANNSLA